VVVSSGLRDRIGAMFHLSVRRINFSVVFYSKKMSYL